MGKIESGQAKYALDEGLIANRGKKDRFDNGAIKKIEGLVDTLASYPPAFWHTGLRMLAEAIVEGIEKRAESNNG
jgi:hypothetical protein